MPVYNNIKDPVMKRGDILIRWGVIVPFGGVAAAIILIAPFGVLPSIHKELFTGYIGVGSLMTWVGLYYIWRSDGWRQGVMFYIILGGILLFILAGTTWMLWLMAIPPVAPVVAGIAWLRSRNKANQSGRVHE